MARHKTDARDYKIISARDLNALIKAAIATTQCITVSATAVRLGVSEGAVRRLIDEGKLKASRVTPTDIRVWVSDIDQYLHETIMTAGCTTTATANERSPINGR